MLAYFILCGIEPFSGTTKADLFKTILKGEPSFKGYDWKVISKDAKDFIRLCLNKKAKKRPSAEELLNHKWI